MTYKGGASAILQKVNSQLKRDKNEVIEEDDGVNVSIFLICE